MNINESVSTNSSVNQKGSQSTVSEVTFKNNTASQQKLITAGQFISGEVVEVNGKSISIQLDQDTVILARLEQDMKITLGQLLTFEVKSINKNQISLSPLFANTAQQATILKALEAADIPANDSAIQMVSELMEEGMSIDKNSIQNIYKQVIANPEANPSTIVLLNRLQISVNPENLQQYSNYLNLKHSILNSIETLGDETLSLSSELLAEGKTQEALQIFKKIIDVFITDTTTDNLDIKNAISNSNFISNQSNSNLSSDLLQTTINEQKTVLEEIDLLVKTLENEIGQIEKTNNSKEGVLLKEILTQVERSKLSELLSQITENDQIKEEIKSGNSSLDSALRLISQAITTDEFPKDALIKELFESKEFTTLLKGVISEQWLLKPDEVSDKKTVEAYYDKLLEQSIKLADSLSNVLKSDSGLLKSAVSIKDNVDFMNQLNQLFTYTQLPLKFSKENAHGELYVYTNKKNLAKEDGNLSALLHLEMEYLGNVDIYVAMQNERLSTRFYLEKEETLNFIADHIHILSDNLAKKGYILNSEFSIREKPVNIMEEIKNEQKSTTLLGQYAFDMRA